MTRGMERSPTTSREPVNVSWAPAPPPAGPDAVPSPATRCVLCGHSVTHLDEEGGLGDCGFASAYWGGVQVRLCHADDHSCYEAWTVRGARPSIERLFRYVADLLVPHDDPAAKDRARARLLRHIEESTGAIRAERGSEMDTTAWGEAQVGRDKTQVEVELSALSASNRTLLEIVGTLEERLRGVLRTAPPQLGDADKMAAVPMDDRVALAVAISGENDSLRRGISVLTDILGRLEL